VTYEKKHNEANGEKTDDGTREPEPKWGSRETNFEVVERGVG